MKRRGETHPGNQKNKSSILLARVESKREAHAAQLVQQEPWLRAVATEGTSNVSAAVSRQDEALSSPE